MSGSRKMDFKVQNVSALGLIFAVRLRSVREFYGRPV